MVAIPNPKASSKKFKLAFFILCLLLFTGALGYRFIEKISLLDSIYMTVITLSTVGYKEVVPLSIPGKIFTIFLIVSGVSLAGYSASTALAYFSSGEWKEDIERKRRDKMIRKLTNHYIVCGYGRTGRYVVEELKAEGKSYVIIDTDPEKISHLSARGELAILGSGSDEEVLIEAKIKEAKGVAAVTSIDNENILIVLTARFLNPSILIVSRASSKNFEQKLIKAGANHVLLPQKVAAWRITSMLIRPEVADFFCEVANVEGNELVVEQILVSPSSSLVGQTLAQSQLHSNLNVTILACKSPDGTWMHAVGGKTTLCAGMTLIALGSRENLHKLLKIANPGSFS
ncbi:potassium channel family protein [Candidatus Methylacidiphilum infernorum]|uniref:Kef-type K+ transport system, predicted NAD-binding component n=1 Tax=Methylacidiphilum infernorum (isolate V4) TaxID=481448 RepID=B3DVR5_METI4|nr:potassium channel protein [Candidatus Methylacidiphilum infernorum]ACD83418.1 Kef-type K+ transport system, predicted NAD-binding component [Methylacidiphilum infernorum V4]